MNNDRFNDSIQFWLGESKNKRLAIKKRRDLLDKSYQKIITNFSTKTNLKLLSEITYQTLLLNDTLKFLNRNKKVIQLAEKRKDSFTQGDAYWNYATLELGLRDYENAFKHFQTAEKYFLNIPFYKAKMLIGKAFIKGRYSDYLGAEEDLSKAIKIFENLKKYKELITCYVSLSNLQIDLELYSKSEEYLYKALLYAKYLDDFDSNHLLNNLALIHQKKRDYRKSVKLFREQLDKVNLKEKPSDYARLLDNLSYTKFLNNDTTGVKKAFYKSLKIRDSLNNKEGVLIAKVHLSEYFQKFKDTVMSLKYAVEANQLALSLKNSREILKTYKMLSILDSQNPDFYLKKYIRFSDSLVDIEREYRNKFARIEFDTDNYIQQNEKLTQERIWIFALSISGVLIILLLYFLRAQKIQNQKLLLETEQQQLNEEFYQLSLGQRQRLEQEKLEERKRISEELHDGVLGKLFGTRLALGFLSVSKDNEVQSKYNGFLEDLQEIEKEIRAVSHQLNDNAVGIDVRFSNLLKDLLQDKSQLGNFTYRLKETYGIQWEALPKKITLNCFRIIQEGINNVLKHTKATEVDLEIVLNKQSLFISLKDNGIGYETTKKKNGIGLKNIASRVKKCEGTFTIHSQKNSGTTLNIQIPTQLI